MTIATGSTILASDVQAIKDDVDAMVSADGDSVSASETTTSGSFTDLTTSGPAVTLTTGTKVRVTISAALSNASAGSRAMMGVEVSGASSVSATIADSLINAGTNTVAASKTILFTGLTAGSNTFTAKYRSEGSNTATFANRGIFVEPIGD